jgi:hypothetical protein
LALVLGPGSAAAAKPSDQTTTTVVAAKGTGPGPSGSSMKAASLVPFSYTFEFSNSMFGRLWYANSSTVCKNMRIFTTAGVTVQMWKAPEGATYQTIGPPVFFPAGGGYYYHCWTGLPVNYRYLRFKYSSSWAQGEGTVY